MLYHRAGDHRRVGHTDQVSHDACADSKSQCNTAFGAALTIGYAFHEPGVDDHLLTSADRGTTMRHAPVRLAVGECRKENQRRAALGSDCEATERRVVEDGLASSLWLTHVHHDLGEPLTAGRMESSGRLHV